MTPGAPTRWAPLAFAIVALGAAAAVLPGVVADPLASLSPDATEFVGIAHSWVHGRGFVDPIVYTTFLPGLKPPAPALAIRPPVVVLLFAAVLAAGGGIAALAVAHALWACGIGASALWVGRRSLGPVAATAFAVALAWSPGWHWASRHLWSEATAVGILLLLLAVARPLLRSCGGALGLAALAVVAWLTRPNLGVVVPALGLAALVDAGPRAALRSRPLWTFAIGFAALHRVVVVAVEASTGFAPYEHYAAAAELLRISDVLLYQKQWVGGVAFVEQNAAAVIAGLGENAAAFYREAFTAPTYLHIGWLALPAVAHGLWRSGPGSLERRYAAFATLGLLVTAVGVFGGYDADRYTLPAFAYLCFLSAGLLEDAGRLLGRSAATSGAPSRLRRAGAALPLLLVLPVLAEGVPAAAQGARRAAALRAAGPPDHPGDAAARALCAHVDRDAVVASTIPWRVYFWCGNAGLWIPRDLDSPEWIDRYLDEWTPGYLLSDGSRAFAPLAASPRLEAVAGRSGIRLYRVLDPDPASRPWRAPPAPASGFAAKR